MLGLRIPCHDVQDLRTQTNVALAVLESVRLEDFRPSASPLAALCSSLLADRAPEGPETLLVECSVSRGFLQFVRSRCARPEWPSRRVRQGCGAEL
mmetsp:Transcript_20762/g.52747  ORF Transcript_20762/g.52747 Transcript_20762/m.52747 type:complete len:96 (-) Transcript_20762:114-401(-)